MKSVWTKFFILLFFLIGLTGLGWAIYGKIQNESTPQKRERELLPTPVEVAAVEYGVISLKRTFSGELEARAGFVAAPKVSGRVERMMVNISDMVKRNQVVARLDDDEYVQAAAQAKADLEVAKANLSRAKSALEIARREFKRTESLLKGGIASDSEFDAAREELEANQALVEVASAEVKKAGSLLETANIRLGYTRIIAGWSDGNEYRVVAERYMDEGQTVAANTPLFLIIELDPVAGVVYVTERDYGRLKAGQPVTISTDAYPNELFSGRIERIAPVFRKSTRQARVEITIDNPEYRLKPGMFIRATVVMSRVPEAVIVPEQALTRREDRTGVFVVDEEGNKVSWREVKVGIREEDRVQVEGKGVSGRVVVLGQQLLDHGSSITIPEHEKVLPR